MAVLQWNLNGLYAHWPEFKHILSHINPQVICLQETRLKPNTCCRVKDYKLYRKDRQHQHASGGVSIFVKKSIYSEEVKINTNMEVIAVKIHNPQTVTLCNIYIPPDLPRDQIKLADIILQLPRPFLLVGDFNAHNIIWGSDHTDRRGKFLEDIFENDTILNTGEPTHFCTRTGKFSHIDITVCDPRIASNLSWETYPDLNGSDHFPIIIRNLLSNTSEQSTEPLNKK